MDSGSTKYSATNPREKANIFSVMFLTFTFQLFKKGYARDLTLEDLWEPLSEHRSEIVGDLLEHEWNKEMLQHKCNGREPSVATAVLKAFRKQFVYLFLAAAVTETSTRMCQPILLGQILRYFSEDSDISLQEALIYATVFMLLTFGYVFFVTHYSMLICNLSMKIRVAICALIYRKVLRLRFSAVRNSLGGEVTNLIATDLKIIPLMLWFIQYLWLSPLLMIALSYAIWLQIAWPGVASVGIILGLSALIRRLLYKYRKLNAQKSDDRVKMMQEILLGVRFIKMYVWEKPFTSLVRLLRRDESKFTTKINYMRGLYLAYLLSSYRLACFCGMLLMSYFGAQFSAEKVFAAAAYFASISYLSSYFICGVMDCSDAAASAKRVENFLLLEEMAMVPDISNSVTVNEDLLENSTVLHDVSASWDHYQKEHALSNVNVRLKRGTLIAIIGPVGSGKTSLLQAILGELQLLNGSVSVDGNVSYASQDPWVFGDTLRQNITFSRPYEKERYDKVVQACALQPDFLRLSNGDMTIVGESGCLLSGGQKARLNLARAVYNEADVYLLDDPLSAVDTHVAQHLFDQCIMSLLSGKTRLLVTHQLQYIKDADHIVFLRNGKVEMQGPFSHFTKSERDCIRLLDTEGVLYQNKESKEIFENIADNKHVTEANGELVQDFKEKSSLGRLRKSVYVEYFFSGSNYLQLFTAAIVILLTQAAANGADYWMSYWTKKEEESQVSELYQYTVFSESSNFSDKSFVPHDPESTPVSEEWTSTTLYCILVYTAIIAALLLLLLVRALIFCAICQSCGNELHNQVVNSIMRSRISFFNTNPSGRILNRLSNDIGVMDQLLPRTLMDALQNLLIAIGTFVLASIVNYWLIIIVATMSVLIYLMGYLYVKTSSRLLRLEGISRSPVFVHLNATLQGLPTIRAMRAQVILMKEFDKHQDFYTSASYASMLAGRTFNLYVDFLCFAFISTVIYSFLLTGKDLYGGDVGLVVTQSYGIIMWLQWGVFQSAVMDGNMRSVERVAEYKYLEEEDNWETSSDNCAPPGWPQNGHIQMHNMSLKYTDNGPLVLKDINVSIKPGEKIGVVGRTGAGKSSLIQALFRLAKVEGFIFIDGVDTNNISLKDLRRNISILPQDPFLFSGTVRENLDLLSEFQDEELWRALESVDMKQQLENKGGLNMQVADKGANFSVGQKQLLCLARVILKKNKILLLDEATSNVDLETDELIQKTLRKMFVHCTVLTIAHRLNTIVDSDKVMVMRSGQLVEFDHPHLLLDRKGTFYEMVKKTGQLKHFSELALQNYNTLKNSA